MPISELEQSQRSFDNVFSLEPNIHEVIDFDTGVNLSKAPAVTPFRCR
jgi:hypothetical protein